MAVTLFANVNVLDCTGTILNVDRINGMNRIAAAAFLLSWLCMSAGASEPELVSVTKIWDQGQHNAFTDLIRFENQWWCTFREAKDHGPSVGKVRVITSQDGAEWTSAALVEQAGVDLRDPKLSIMPDRRLMLIMGGSVYSVGGPHGTRAPRVSFSKTGRDWTEPRKLLAEDHWLWRVTWQGDWGWSVSKLGEGRDPRRGMLYRTRDGLEWEWITEFRLPDNTWNASETTLRFMPDGELIALTRPHWIGTSRPPYTDWSWTRIEQNIGGPNFIRLPDGSLWAAARCGGGERHGKHPERRGLQLGRGGGPGEPHRRGVPG